MKFIIKTQVVTKNKRHNARNIQKEDFYHRIQLKFLHKRWVWRMNKWWVKEITKDQVEWEWNADDKIFIFSANTHMLKLHVATLWMHWTPQFVWKEATHNIKKGESINKLSKSFYYSPDRGFAWRQWKSIHNRNNCECESNFSLYMNIMTSYQTSLIDRSSEKGRKLVF